MSKIYIDRRQKIFFTIYDYLWDSLLQAPREIVTIDEMARSLDITIIPELRNGRPIIGLHIEEELLSFILLCDKNDQ